MRRTEKRGEKYREEGGKRGRKGIGLPDRFVLLISPVKTVHRECQLVWSSEFEVGIKLCRVKNFGS
jgi:hypothetical protein